MPKKQKLQGRKVQKPNKLAAKVSAGPTTTAHAARSPLGKPISHYKAECNLKSFRKEAKRNDLQQSGDNQGEFVFLRGSSTPDKLLLFSLLNRYLPFLHQLLEGIVLPGSNNSPYGHHNQVQVAVKRPGFEGYTDLARNLCLKIKSYESEAFD
eukprot:g858.t1